ncbi:protein-tyrosine phosphatase-like protein [Zychaea mexicana]|uniref:protein-tyrosine phosphatase-like protein n=1 Tax=Zychaea mexicana TaxID=64656 RepID=UPI0022FF1DC1|nr:protein-tyrosine phosphatase-like protein [Zychaea mexicana]KAI9470427.1 protein-tyrosine phosphatase-like protein [Zychaea mexicana]
MSLNTVSTREDYEDRPSCTQQESSLGISQALKAAPGSGADRKRKTSLRDDTFREAGESDNLLVWARFYISLYYNKILVGMLGCVTGWAWYNRIDRHVLLGALPTPTHIKDLHSQERVQAIVNLCAEFPGYKSLYDELGMKQTLLPTSDFTIPHLEHIEQGVDDILDIAQQNLGCIYLHCKAGRGRSAAIALCYLLRMYLLSPAEAQDILLRCRPQVDKDLFQTDEVRAYYKNLISQAESGKITRIPCSIE